MLLLFSLDLRCLVSNPLLTDDDDLIHVTLSDDLADDIADVSVADS